MNDQQEFWCLNADDLQLQIPIINGNPDQTIVILPLLSSTTVGPPAFSNANSTCALPMRCLRADRVNLTCTTAIMSDTIDDRHSTEVIELVGRIEAESWDVRLP